MKVQRYFLMIVLAVCYAGSVVDSAFGSARIEWEVGNRFRAFDYQAGSKQSPDLATTQFAQYKKGEYEKTEDWLKRIIEKHSPYMTAAGPWNESQGKYENGFVDLPKFVFVTVRLVWDNNDVNELSHKPCLWRTATNQTFQPCNDSFIIPKMDSAGTQITVYQDGTEIASERVIPELKIILGLGDSYAAGEGNPDSPAKWRVSGREKWPPVNDTAASQLVLKPAQWWSNRCDRSFYSYQNLVALRVASENPHAVIAFVHLACSGAEIIDGLLAPQRFPPGHSMHRCQPPHKRSDPDEWDKQCDVPYSQINAAVDLLCPENSKPLSADQIKQIKGALKNIGHNATQRNWLNYKPEERLRFCPKPLRNVDYVLLSIGGNDVGFSGLIADALLPRDTHIRAPLLRSFAKTIVEIVQKEGKVVCPYLPARTTPEDDERHKQCKKYGLTGEDRIKDIPYRYAALKIAFEHVLQLKSDEKHFTQLNSDEKRLTPNKIMLNLYPNPLYTSERVYCGNPPGKPANEKRKNKARKKPTNEWAAIHTFLPPSKGLLFKGGYEWEVNFTTGEAEDVEQHVIDPLNLKINEMGNGFGWKVISTQNIMKDHGWCTGDSRLLPDVNPTQWAPYADHQRFIRTANDSLLTQWPRTGLETESGNSKIIERENSLYGMFHPNAQGHAAIAKEVMDQTQIGAASREKNP